MANKPRARLKNTRASQYQPTTPNATNSPINFGANVENTPVLTGAMAQSIVITTMLQASKDQLSVSVTDVDASGQRLAIIFSLLMR